MEAGVLVFVDGLRGGLGCFGESEGVAFSALSLLSAGSSAVDIIDTLSNPVLIPIRNEVFDYLFSYLLPSRRLCIKGSHPRK